MKISFHCYSPGCDIFMCSDHTELFSVPKAGMAGSVHPAVTFPSRVYKGRLPCCSLPKARVCAGQGMGTACASPCKGCWPPVLLCYVHARVRVGSGALGSAWCSSRGCDPWMVPCGGLSHGTTEAVWPGQPPACTGPQALAPSWSCCCLAAVISCLLEKS